MKKLLMALAVGTALTVPQMPASAACIHVNEDLSVDVHPAECTDIVDGPSFGGCSFVAATDAVAGQGQMTGEMDIEAVVYSATDPTDNPMTATFTCYIKVNGSTQPGAICTATGTVVVAGGCVITYTSNSVTDFVQLCQDVDYANTDYPDTSECFEASTFEIPPPIFWEIVDGAVCPILAMAAGTYGGPPPIPVIVITPEGDVYIDGEFVYDCPPYAPPA